MAGERSLLDSFDGPGYSQEITYLERAVSAILGLLGIVAVFLGMSLVFTILRPSLGDTVAGTITAVLTLVWACWPSKKKEG